jgi:hypothetical protein
MGSSPIAELLSVYSSTTLLQTVGLATTQKLEKIDPKYGLSDALMGARWYSAHRIRPPVRLSSPPMTFAVIDTTAVGFVLWASG